MATADGIYLGAAVGHAHGIATRGNRHPGNAGPVFYIDIPAPAVMILAMLRARPWRPTS